MAKNPKNNTQTSAETERARRELEELKKKLHAETEADMIVLRALVDAEKQARGIEQAAEDYSVGVEWRLTESERAIDAQERAAVRAAEKGDAAEAAKAADEKIAAIRKDAEAKRAVISERFEQRRAEYADKVFSLVIGAADE